MEADEDDRTIPPLPPPVAELAPLAAIPIAKQLLAADLVSPLARPPAPRPPLSRDNPAGIGRLTWEYIGYEEHRLAWNAAADLRQTDFQKSLACNRVLERIESAVETYVRSTGSPLNTYYVKGLNSFRRQWHETWALCYDESEGSGLNNEAWYQPIGPPWTEFEYEYVLAGWHVQSDCHCHACNTLIQQADELVLAQDMVQEGGFCSLDCAQWHRRQLWERAPQLAPFLLDPCPLLRPLPKTRDEMLAYWLTLPNMLVHDWNPDPVDYLAIQPGLRPRAASKVLRVPRVFTGGKRIMIMLAYDICEWHFKLPAIKEPGGKHQLVSPLEVYLLESAAFSEDECVLCLVPCFCEVTSGKVELHLVRVPIKELSENEYTRSRPVETAEQFKSEVVP